MWVSSLPKQQSSQEDPYFRSPKAPNAGVASSPPHPHTEQHHQGLTLTVKEG